MRQDFRDILGSDQLAVGTWTQIPAPELLDLLARFEFVFTVIDCQHGPFGLETADNLARAADANQLAAVVRVAKNDPVDIMKFLDAGIPNVVVPNIETAEEAARSVAATQFGPDGLRGACPCCRSCDHYLRDWPEYCEAENSRAGAIALVETTTGYRNIEDICATPGLLALVPGPFDLSVSMGLAGNWRHPDVVKALETMVLCAVDHDLPVMYPVFSEDQSECRELIAKWREFGVNTFVIGSDKIIYAEALSRWQTTLSG